MVKYRVAQQFQGEASYFVTTMFAAVQYLSTQSTMAKKLQESLLISETDDKYEAKQEVQEEKVLSPRERREIISKKLLSDPETLSKTDMMFILESFVKTND